MSDDDRAELIRGQYLPPQLSLILMVTVLISFSFYLSVGTLAKLQEREDFIRESWIKAMEARLVRDELVKCQRHEGVNSLENCRWLSEKYAQMLIENKVCRSVPHDIGTDMYVSWLIGKGVQEN